MRLGKKQNKKEFVYVCEIMVVYFLEKNDWHYLTLSKLDISIVLDLSTCTRPWTSSF